MDTKKSNQTNSNNRELVYPPSYEAKRSQSSDSKKKGDLDGDGDVDFVDRLLAIVSFIQTPKGQIFIMLAGAIFFAIINVPSYSKTVESFLRLVSAQWLLAFSWLIAFLTWALIQVFETLPRTDFWDYDVKVQILKTLNGLHVPIVSRTEGKQTDLLYWQDVTVRDAELRRKMFIVASIVAHIGDFGMLWTDYPLWQGGLWGLLVPSNWLLQNVLITCFLVFGFEVLIGLARSVKQFLGGYEQAK
ncbi:hypothetical protein [Leptolyngbya sp. NIES-2104]|uniref:hypothetical protein n=1 Tax=Leptolyngbya sp. NIES-2104 TaxID=1552121 RepID=UPI0006EC8B42|nr:hypothetical protein [Leptolyngbya sp. NIES-2104]GAQ00160.1 hypothetical protein NIES2104_67250 [Leptolyngbya sp. NIES-2104]